MSQSFNLQDPYHGAQAMILGASGFIGRWVARALCARGAKVNLVVRNGKTAERIFSTYGVHGDCSELDLRNLDAVKKLLQTVSPSIVFNLSGYGMDRSERDSGIAYRINFELVDVLSERMVQGGDPNWKGQSIVHVGSPLEYGTIGGKLAEDSVPNPTTLYGASKLAGTESLVRWCKACDFKGVTARPFTVYGPGEPRGRLLPSLLETAKSGKNLPLTTGEQKRDFVYVEDVAEGLLRLGLAPALPGQIVNLATGRLTSVRTFAETAAQVMGIPRDRLKFGDLPLLDEEMHHSEVTTESLRQLTGWQPPTGIADGILKTVDRISCLSLVGDSFRHGSSASL